MRQFLKRVFTRLALNDTTWFVLKPFSKAGFFLYQARKSVSKESPDNHFVRSLFPTLAVQNGPFKGMIYPELNSIGSAIFPKLLGSYEKELWDTIDNFKINSYTEIIDIGCAEGYYAVGLAMIIPNARVYAYDIVEVARKSCEKMAVTNKVKDRITIRSECTAEALGSFPFTGRGLIVCDCEGFEKQLFNKQNVANLINCDLIIEVHDFVDITNSGYIKEIFRETHNMTSIKSTDDIEKAYSYDFKGLEQFSLTERKQLVGEQRPTIMEWVICRSKK